MIINLSDKLPWKIRCDYLVTGFGNLYRRTYNIPIDDHAQ
jgi:hypothetical protein